MLTSQFLDCAGTLFDARLLSRLGGRVVVASAIAEVVIETAKDILAWTRGELTFEQVMRRAGVAVFAGAGAVGGWMLAARLASNMGAVGALAVTLLGAWAGAKLGERLGEKLFLTASSPGQTAQGPHPNGPYMARGIGGPLFPVEGWTNCLPYSRRVGVIITRTRQVFEPSAFEPSDGWGR